VSVAPQTASDFNASPDYQSSKRRQLRAHGPRLVSCRGRRLVFAPSQDRWRDRSHETDRCEYMRSEAFDFFGERHRLVNLRHRLCGVGLLVAIEFEFDGVPSTEIDSRWDRCGTFHDRNQAKCWSRRRPMGQAAALALYFA